MIRSIIICAIIIIAGALLGWREKQQLSLEKKANEKLLRKIANDPSIDSQSPISIERRKAELAMKAKVKNLTRDYFALRLNYDANPKGAPGEDFAKQLEIETYMKSRLAEFDPTTIKLFIDECNSNPDTNPSIKRDLNFHVRTLFIAKYPIEMARMIGESPELFGINDKTVPEGYIQDPFRHLVYYYSYEKKDLQTVFQCLSESPPAFQSKYIDGAVQFGTGSPTQRAELLEEMRYFATTPEQKELVNSKLSDLAFGRPDVKGSFIELSDWIASANLSSEELVAATKEMHNNTRVGDTGQWLDWLTKNDLPDEVAKQRASELASRWTEKDYKAVGQWLNSSPDSPEKIAVAGAYAAKSYPYDPENAMKWVQTIPQGPERTKALETIYRGMQKNENFEKEAVEAFARENGISK